MAFGKNRKRAEQQAAQQQMELSRQQMNLQQQNLTDNNSLLREQLTQQNELARSANERAGRLDESALQLNREAQEEAIRQSRGFEGQVNTLRGNQLQRHAGTIALRDNGTKLLEGQRTGADVGTLLAGQSQVLRSAARNSQMSRQMSRNTGLRALSGGADANYQAALDAQQGALSERAYGDQMSGLYTSALDRAKADVIGAEETLNQDDYSLLNALNGVVANANTNRSVAYAAQGAANDAYGRGQQERAGAQGILGQMSANSGQMAGMASNMYGLANQRYEQNRSQLGGQLLNAGVGLAGGFMACVSLSTRILTTEGYVKAGDISSNDVLLSLRGDGKLEPQRLINIRITPHQKVVRLNLGAEIAKGFVMTESIVCTPTHSFARYPGDAEGVEVSRMSVGDVLPIYKFDEVTYVKIMSIEEESQTESVIIFEVESPGNNFISNGLISIDDSE